MAFRPGKYTIRNKGAEAFVQRNTREDKSLHPKQVISVPAGVENRAWSIEPEGDLYVLKAGGAPVIVKDGLVFVSLLEDEPSVKWRLTHVPHVGENIYLIVNPANNQGWILPEQEPYTQVACRHLIVGPSEPPFYPPTQLWTIVPCYDEE